MKSMDALKILIKVLYIMPAVLWGTIYTCIILLGGIGNLSPVSLSYPILFLIAAVLLWKDKWYGCISGILPGIFMLMLTPDARNTGLFFCIYFAALGLICRKLHKN